MQRLFRFVLISGMALGLRGASFPVAPNTTIPTVDKGYVLVAQKQSCNLTVFRPSGQLAFTTTLKGPAGQDCSIWAMAVDTDGSVAAAITYAQSPSAAAAVAITNPEGMQTSYIPTSRYNPTQITFDRDHTVWTLGWQRDEVKLDTEDSRDYDVARHFERGGKLLGSFLKRSTWARNATPFSQGLGYWNMTAGQDRIAAFLPGTRERASEWIEWSRHGQLLTRIQVEQQMRLGRALVKSDRVFGCWTGDTTDPQPACGEYNRTKGTWTPISIPFKHGMLFGSDGENLLFADGDVAGSLALKPMAPPTPL